ncbi:PspC domain-containing protein [Paenibacillus sacheonensis]|uniref:PspC domain-containing protein n=1 Tax=Paenibacillus sacheonensis TaxID=742054 RepID=A0A7X4YUP5_9BACL|nr:PspC domain-containing protein [Paenibacillus sacheonensis]MBM7569116.1 phage shock protein PspC (stress-responsive transcriptional regulator) [Paenibacillus sacheonensis]NBC72950.1 PspC domain-containing protein [Paenibacillus sacheonensis]
MKKLYRSRRDKKLFGLCGGLAEMLNVDATLVRILLIVVTVFTSGALILVYILAGLVVPQNPYDFGGGYGSGKNGFGGGWNNPNNGPFGGGSNFGGGQGFGPGTGGPYGSSYGGQSQPGPTWQKPPAQTTAQPASNIDAMMEDLEKRALKKEIEELRAKLAKHENEKGDV